MATGYEKKGGFDKFGGRDAGELTHYDHDVYTPLTDPIFDIRITTGATGATPPPLSVGTSEVGSVDCVVISNPDSVTQVVTLYDAYGVIYSGSLATLTNVVVGPGLKRDFRAPLVLTQHSVNGTKALTGYSVRAIGLGRLDAAPASAGYPPAPLQSSLDSSAISFVADASAGTAWNPVPAAYTELFGDTDNRMAANLGRVTQVGLSTQVQAPGLQVLGIKVQYSIDSGTVWSDLTTAWEPGAAEGAAYSGKPYWTGWESIPSPAKTSNVFLRVAMKGDAASSSLIGSQILFVR